MYTNVLSKEGEKQLKNIVYEDNKYDTKRCPITFIQFKDNDIVTQLPCKHIFNKDGIEKWLMEENSICPICRYKLKHKEIKNNVNNIIINNEDINNEYNIFDMSNNNGFIDRMLEQIEMNHSTINNNLIYY